MGDSGGGGFPPPPTGFGPDCSKAEFAESLFCRGPPPIVNPPCNQCGPPNCGDCPPDFPNPGDDEAPLPQPGDLPILPSTIPPGMIPTGDPNVFMDPGNGNIVQIDGTVIGNVPRDFRPVLSEPGHFLNPRTREIVDMDGNVIRIASRAEVVQILESTIPSQTYLIEGVGYLDPRTLFVHAFDGTIIREATQEDIALVTGRVPDGMIDVGYGYVDPDTMNLHHYDGAIIRKISQNEFNRIKQVPPEGFLAVADGYYDPNTGFIHDFFGRKMRKPTPDEIQRIISQLTPSTNIPSPNVAPTINTIPDQTVEEDGSLEDLDLKQFKFDEEDNVDDLTWRITSGDPDKIIATLLSNEKIRFTLLPNATGTVEVTVTLEDTDGMEASNTITVNILPVNDAPTITSDPPIITSSRLNYIYDISGFDIDGDDVSFELIKGLDGMTLDSTGFDTAQIKWKPDKRGKTEPVTVIIKDLNEAKGFQTWIIDVR